MRPITRFKLVLEKEKQTHLFHRICASRAVECFLFAKVKREFVKRNPKDLCHTIKKIFFYITCNFAIKRYHLYVFNLKLYLYFQTTDI